MIYPETVTVASKVYRPAPPVDVNFLHFYRQPHDVELIVPGVKADIDSKDRYYRGNSYGTARSVPSWLTSIPEVFQLVPEHVTPLDERWVNLTCEINYELPRDKALEIFDPNWAFNNSRETPGFDKPRACGGSLLKCTKEGENLRIETMLSNGPVPTAQYVLDRPWLWYYATAVNENGQVSYMRLGDGNGNRVRIRVPLITRLTVYVPAPWLHELAPGFMPDSLWLS